MCSICRKFKKGSLTVEEAREELEEQAEYLTEEHIEEIEELLFEAEDTYDYITERKKASLEYDEDDEDYEDDELPEFDEEYNLDKEDD
jgi:CTP:phosphocholine cytidylyltransferase-like protein